MPPSQSEPAPAAQPPRSSEPDLAYALVISTGPDEFVVVGQGVSLSAAPETPGPKIAGFASIDEGRYEKGLWIPGRRLNGDESGGGARASIRGPGIGVLKIKLYRYE